MLLQFFGLPSAALFGVIFIMARIAQAAQVFKGQGKDAPLSPRTVRHYYDTMDAMLDKAVQWDILRKNPMEKVDRPAAKKARVHYLTEERAVELLRCLHDEPNMCYRAAVLLAFSQTPPVFPQFANSPVEKQGF